MSSHLEAVFKEHNTNDERGIIIIIIIDPILKMR